MRLPTRAEYDVATPFAKGYMAYMYSHWPLSKIPSEGECPYAEGTPEREEFQRGVTKGLQEAQDSEE